MRAVWLQPDEAYLEERHRRGQDKKDELWDGVLHMVPPASYLHGHFDVELVVALRSIGKRRGWLAHTDNLGLFASEKSYRIPDATLARPDQVSKRGLEGAELVVEVLSPDDESYDKLPFYAKLGVREVWIIDPETRAVEIYALTQRAYQSVANDRSPLLGITLEIIAGPKLRLRDGDDVYEV